jgi:hypothetical protein
MNTSHLAPCVRGGALLVALGVAAVPPEAPPRAEAAPAPTPPAAKRSPLGKNLFFEVQGTTKRVVIRAHVCLRAGQLEGLLTRKGTKEHEYVLAADVDARQVHAALIVAGARPGAPVRFAPKYQAAHGSVIKVSLQYQKEGKTVTVPAGQWVRAAKTKNDLDRDWVFGGSRLVPHPDQNKPPLYLANQGDVICVCNMDTAMLDLPVRSPKKFDERVFDAHTERIPALNTPVDVILEPVPDKKGPGKTK